MRAILHTWTFFTLYWTVLANCKIPQISSPKSRLFVYQKAGTVNVIVHHCLYREEKYCDRGICSNCRTGEGINATVRKSTYNYSDITRNCLIYSNNPTSGFKDKFEFSSRGVLSYDCNNNTKKLVKNITVTLTNHKTEANLARDAISLPSGTTCKFSSGFCHDPIEGIDVIWEVPTYDSCDAYREVNVSDAYYFSFDEKKCYAVIELHGRYYVLKLETWQDLCSVRAQTTHVEGLIVSEKRIIHADNSTLETTDYSGLSFQRKQDLYDFLTEQCEDSSVSFLERSIFTDIQVKRQNGYLEQLKMELQRLKFHLEIAFYAIAFVLFCLITVAVALMCVRQNGQNVTSAKAENGVSKLVTTVSNYYEYITPEYNIKTIYNGVVLRK